MKAVVFCIGLILSGLSFVFGQSGNNGTYNLQFSLVSIDCDNEGLLVDLQIQANSPSTTFHLSDQNYRFSFPSNAIHPFSVPVEYPNTNPVNESIYIEEELAISGFAFRDGAFSFYEIHTMTGSIDTIVSYNVALAGGDGYPIYAGEWISVGRLKVKYHDDEGDGYDPVELVWHTQDPNTWPHTFVGEVFNGMKVQAFEGLYFDFFLDPDDFCGSVLPIELAYFKGYDQGCQVRLEWETISEKENDYFIIEKSPDGISYRDIGIVDGSGTTTTPVFYAYEDEDVSEDNYYKLTQVDYDGKKSTSQAIHVRSSCYDENVVTGIIGIYPNPLMPGKPIKLNIYSNKEIESAEVLVSDLLGRVIIRNNANLLQGANKISIDAANLARGSYFVYVKGKDWISDPGKFLKID